MRWPEGPAILYELYSLIQERREQRRKGLQPTFNEGIDKIQRRWARKTEVIIAAKNNSKEELVYETADLLYHLLVLWSNRTLRADILRN